MKRFIVMTFGYAYDAAVAPMIYQVQRNSWFESMKSAITNLALDLYAKYCEEHKYQRYQNVKPCCELNNNKHAVFCMKCGNRLAPPSFDPDEFMAYVKELRVTTADAYGDVSGGTEERAFAWTPYWTKNFIGAPKEEVIYIAENAERVLLSALLEYKPELLPEKEHIYWAAMRTDWEKFRAEKQPTYE